MEEEGAAEEEERPMKRTKDASDALTDGLRIYLDDLEGEEEEGEEEEEMEVEGGQQQRRDARQQPSRRMLCVLHRLWRAALHGHGYCRRVPLMLHREYAAREMGM